MLLEKLLDQKIGNKEEAVALSRLRKDLKQVLIESVLVIHPVWLYG